MIKRELTIDDIEVYRLERGLSVSAIAREIGVTPDVYTTNVTGRIWNGEFLKTAPQKRNAVKFERYLLANDEAIREALNAQTVAFETPDGGFIAVHGNMSFTIEPKGAQANA